MADIYTKEKRSAVMACIRSVGTKPEKRLYALVREIAGTRRRIATNVKSLPGCPDILIPSLRLTVFCDGCFYHSCPSHGHTPKSNVAYWSAKLRRNRTRDRKNRRALRALGFTVLRIWEHDLRQTKLPKARRSLLRIFQKIENTPRIGSRT
jgi:DNA mismatch endonuclease, patch repair protein